MTQQQAQILVSILHRMNARNHDDVIRQMIDDLANALGAYSETGTSPDVSAGAPEVGRPTLTVTEQGD